MTTPAKRHGAGAYERLTNAYQKKLLTAYQRWQVLVAREMLAAHGRGVPKRALPAILHTRIPLLQANLQELGRQNITAAAKLAVGRKASLTPTVQAATYRNIALNANLLTTHLLVDIDKGVTQAIVDTERPIDREYLAGAFQPYRSRVASYSGGAWVAIFETQKQVASDTKDERRVRWVLHPEAEHCIGGKGKYGCPDLEGEYDSFAALPTVPAGSEIQCRGNCRCWLELERSSGNWQRGLG